MAYTLTYALITIAWSHQNINFSKLKFVGNGGDAKYEFQKYSKQNYLRHICSSRKLINYYSEN